MLLHLCRWLQNSSFIVSINGTPWTAAALEIVHYFSMFILVGTMVIVVLLAITASIIVQQKVPKWNQMPAMPAWAKLIALVSIGLWIGAIIAGVEVPALTGIG